VLDACSAPGGKTGHILEQQNSITVDACDIDKKRLERVQENLNRLNLKANIQQADMLDKAAFEANTFDRILLDAPCSALGIIRRHPDIKFLRKETDIDNLGNIQQAILDNGWFWLKTGGTLLYATCSILKQENEGQITQFLAKHNDAKLVKIEIGINSHSEIGLQILPGENKMDGFYYAKLEKQE
jgi:16S rRNA (cytosine967-C5)-methyltransferase